MPDLVQLIATWGRTPLPAATQQIGYLLIEAQPNAQTATTTAPITFCMVLDRSGSMDGAKIEHLKRAVQDVIAGLQPDDQVAVIVFDEHAEVVVPLQPAGNKTALNNRVEAIRVQGGTAMSTGLAAATNELQRATANAHVLLLTDGQTWGDEDRCREIAQYLAQQGVRITALGLGDEWNEGLLDELAQSTGGTSDYIAKPQDLLPSFRRVAQTAHTVAVRDAQLVVQFADGMEPRTVYRVTPQISNLGYTPVAERTISVNLGDVAATVGASVLVEVALPPLPVGTHPVAQAGLSFEAAQDGHEDRTRTDVVLDVTADASAVQVNPRIMNTVEKVTAFKLQTRALSEAAAGDIVGATQKLRGAATRLLSLGETELASTVERAADAVERGQGPSAADQKEITYSTRRLSLKDLQQES